MLLMPLWAYPPALLGLLAPPVLAAIYLFRRRHRRHVVSTLIFWDQPPGSRDGGRRLNRLQTPLLFFLECLVLLLLILAAADPRVTGHAGGQPVVVVLDDSYSMLARADAPGSADPMDATPRARARQAIREHLAHSGSPARFVLAGLVPRVVGESVTEWSQASVQLDRRWSCRSVVIGSGRVGAWLRWPICP